MLWNHCQELSAVTHILVKWLFQPQFVLSVTACACLMSLSPLFMVIQKEFITWHTHRRTGCGHSRWYAERHMPHISSHICHVKNFFSLSTAWPLISRKTVRSLKSCLSILYTRLPFVEVLWRFCSVPFGFLKFLLLLQVRAARGERVGVVN